MVIFETIMLKSQDLKPCGLYVELLYINDIMSLTRKLVKTEIKLLHEKQSL